MIPKKASHLKLSHFEKSHKTQIEKAKNNSFLIEKPEGVISSSELSSPIQKKIPGRFRLNLPWRQKMNLKKKPTRSYLITMRFGNGTRRTFVIVAEHDQVTFTFNKGIYQLVFEEAFYDLSTNQFHLDYHERYPTPLNREVVVDDTGNDNASFFCVTPGTLAELVKMKIVKAIVTPENIIPKWVWWTLGIGGAVVLFMLSRGG